MRWQDRYVCGRRNLTTQQMTRSDPDSCSFTDASGLKTSGHLYVCESGGPAAASMPAMAPAAVSPPKGPSATVESSNVKEWAHGRRSRCSFPLFVRSLLDGCRDQFPWL